MFLFRGKFEVRCPQSRNGVSVVSDGMSFTTSLHSKLATRASEEKQTLPFEHFLENLRHFINHDNKFIGANNCQSSESERDAKHSRDNLRDNRFPSPATTWN